ncbi:MAG: hypothetical protein IRZ28_06830 [Steroidobacteraceae bacterium]|nr:hypothetical protein [Steroidobacteraceae bacterium]
MTHADRELDKMLRSPEPELPDSGFTETVLRRLPTKRWARTPMRRWTLASAAALGSLSTYLLADPIEHALSTYAAFPAPVLTIATLALLVSLPLAWILYTE